MFKIPVRLMFVKNNRIVEVKMDKRLSFEDNFKMLNKLWNYSDEKFYVFDPIRKIFLRRDIPLLQFEIETFRMFHLFTA